MKGPKQCKTLRQAILCRTSPWYIPLLCWVGVFGAVFRWIDLDWYWWLGCDGRKKAGDPQRRCSFIAQKLEPIAVSPTARYTIFQNIECHQDGPWSIGKYQFVSTRYVKASIPNKAYHMSFQSISIEVVANSAKTKVWNPALLPRGHHEHQFSVVRKFLTSKLSVE